MGGCGPARAVDTLLFMASPLSSVDQVFAAWSALSRMRPLGSASFPHPQSESSSRDSSERQILATEKRSLLAKPRAEFP